MVAKWFILLLPGDTELDSQVDTTCFTESQTRETESEDDERNPSPCNNQDDLLLCAQKHLYNSVTIIH